MAMPIFNISKVLTLAAVSLFCAPATAASLKSNPALIAAGPQLLAPPNLTFPTPFKYLKTHSLGSMSGALPVLINHSTVPDPYDFHRAGSLLTVEFYGYGPRLGFSAVDACCRKASVDSKKHDHGELMGTEERTYNCGIVFLHVYPGEEMTWGMLNDLQMGMRQFLLEITESPWQTSFIVLTEGVEGDVGHGFLGL